MSSFLKPPSDWKIISIESDSKLTAIAREEPANEARLTMIELPGEDFLGRPVARRYDLVFRQAWPGKF